MKILKIVMEGHGGMFQNCALLANALSKTHEVSVILPKGAKREYLNSNVEVVELPVGDTKLNFVLNSLNVVNFIKVLRAIRRINPDVLHFYTPYNPWLIPLFPFLKKYVMVVTIPEGKLHWGMDRRYELKITRDIHIKRADALFFYSKKYAEQASKYAQDKRIFVVATGANTLFLRYANRNLKEANNILYFGGIAPFKGLEYLLKALHTIRKKFPEVTLTIAGRGDIRPYKHLMRELDNIIVDNKFIRPQDVARYFQQSKIVVLPYVEYDFSGVLHIAFSFGKPIIGTTYLADDIENGKTGLIVPPRDSEALAEAISKLIENEELRKELGRKARKKAEKELSWDQMAMEASKAYEHITHVRLKR